MRLLPVQVSATLTPNRFGIKDDLKKFDSISERKILTMISEPFGIGYCGQRAIAIKRRHQNGIFLAQNVLNSHH